MRLSAKVMATVDGAIGGLLSASLYNSAKHWSAPENAAR